MTRGQWTTRERGRRVGAVDPPRAWADEVVLLRAGRGVPTPPGAGLDVLVLVGTGRGDVIPPGAGKGPSPGAHVEVGRPVWAAGCPGAR